MIPEYATLAPLPAWPPATAADAIVALHHFLAVEQHRARIAERSGRTVIILDRSPLTLIAHEYGMKRLGVPAAPAHAARLYADVADQGRILTPDAYIHLAVPAEVAAVRHAARRPVPAHLVDPQTEAGITAATGAYLSAVPESRLLLLDGTTPVTRLVHKARVFIRELSRSSHQMPPSWRILADADVVHQSPRVAPSGGR